MRPASETATELRRVAAQVRKQAERLERMAFNLEAGRAMADGFGKAVVVEADDALPEGIDPVIP